MKKTMQIDLSSDRLIAIAADLVEEHNYIEALKMLNKNAERNANDGDSYMLYAEIFDDLGLNEKCINYWYKYLDVDESEETDEAFEGIAVAYLNLGKDSAAAFYYNLLLMSTDGIDAETRGEILSSFMSRERNPLKFVYPPKLSDCSEILSSGIDFMRRGEFDEAIDEFSKVDEENDAYISARNYIAMCNIICDKCEEAEQECLAVLKKQPDSIQALTTLAAVKTEQKKSEESRELAKKLLSLNVTSSEDIYKIATVCCENKMHAEAYELFCKLDNELCYDKSMLYFKAVSAFNSGRYEESFSAFDKLLTIYPNSVTARYYYDQARDAAENGTELELSYFYRMPQAERESTLKLLAAFSSLKASEAEKLFKVADITDCILWCFDEVESTDDNELQILAAVCAVKARLDDLVRDLLLNAFVADSLKVRILILLGERNEENIFSTVICDLYKRVEFYKLDIGRTKRKNFISAFARLNSQFGVINRDYCEKMAHAAERLYKNLESTGRLACASDINALTAAIFVLSDIKEAGIKRSAISSYFGTSDSKIKEILGNL